MSIPLMIRRAVLRSLSLAVGVAAIACTSAPLAPSASIGTPQALQPADGAQVANSSQPITLVTQNVAAFGSASPTYTFEVATDSSFTAFTSKVQVKDGVAQGSGQTSVTLDPLAEAKEYYWHVRAQSGTTIGPFSAPFKFTIGSAVTIGAPTAVSPADGAQTSTRPIFTVNNGSVVGTPGAVTYKFDISTTSSFASIVATGTVAAGASQTSFTPATDLPTTSTLFWRATGLDATTNVTGTAGAARSFTTGTALWPGVQPTGTSGHAVQGTNWQTQNLVSFDGVPFTSPPLDTRQIFDLLDRGFTGQGAIDWMKANGYFTAAVFYSNVNGGAGAGAIDVIGFPFQYMAHENGQWNLTTRTGS